MTPSGLFLNMGRAIPSFILLLVLLSMTSSDPQPRKMTEKYFPDIFQVESVTPALKKEKGFTRYEEMMAFLRELQKIAPEWVEISFLGESHHGKPIPLVRIHPHQNHTENKTASPPIEVWMQGGLHGDEPASTEGLLYFLYQCVQSRAQATHFSDIALNVVPMVNPDGYEIQDRENAQGLDLNRDQTKLMATESMPLKRQMARIQPHVAVDFHEYRPFRRDYVHMGTFGVCGAYDVMLLNSTHPNLPQSWIDLRESTFIIPLREELDRMGITHHDYFTPEEANGKTVFRIGSDNARSSASNFALQGMISSLVEVRGVGLGRTSFRRRIYTTYLIAHTYLIQAARHANKLREQRVQRILLDSLAIRSLRLQRNDSLTFLDIEQNHRIRLPVTLDDARVQEVQHRRKSPKAYAVPLSQTKILERLYAFGLHGDTLPAGRRMEVEAYITANVIVEPIPYEKVRRQQLSVQTHRISLSNPEPWVIFSMNQTQALIMPELLEPDAPNSLFSFSVVGVASNSQLPVYRILP
jgi:hypothetical protein